jgi:hypothetical protein
VRILKIISAAAGLTAIVVATLGVATAAPAHATVFTFNSDPFTGSTALTSAGRQIVGNELNIPVFSIANDVFEFDPAFFAIGNQINFVNDLVGNLPTGGVNVIVLQTTDNDGDATTPFLAGNAANIIAEQITQDGAGFFVYFNSNLDLPRLVFSTNLNDNTADLKVLARMENLIDPSVLPTFTEANFTAIPEPSTLSLVGAGLVAGAMFMRRRRVQTAGVSA